jgi:hypothetical protein
MIESALRTMDAGQRLRLVPRGNCRSIDDDTALVLLTHVHYKTADVFDMAAVTAQAQARGALVLWDLSHSMGALPVDLNGANADLAVGCGYKFLNGGPGAPAFLFVAERHQGGLQSPLGGWMGHARPFDFVDGYEAAPGIARFGCGTPSILAIAALESGVDLHLSADMEAVARKSRALAELFIDLVEARCAQFGIALVGPPRGAPRGSHVSFRHPRAYEIVQALIARNVIGDFRAPDVMRFGLTPLPALRRHPARGGRATRRYDDRRVARAAIQRAPRGHLNDVGFSVRLVRLAEEWRRDDRPAAANAAGRSCIRSCSRWGRSLPGVRSVLLPHRRRLAARRLELDVVQLLDRQRLRPVTLDVGDGHPPVARMVHRLAPRREQVRLTECLHRQARIGESLAAQVLPHGFDASFGERLVPAPTRARRCDRPRCAGRLLRELSANASSTVLVAGARNGLVEGEVHDRRHPREHVGRGPAWRPAPSGVGRRDRDNRRLRIRLG